MQEVDVEVVGVESPEASLDRRADVPARRAAGGDIRPGRAVPLSGDHHVVAAGCDQLAQDLLRAPAGIYIGAVEKVDAGLAAALEHRRGGSLVGVAAERHDAEAEGRNADA